MMIPRGRAVVDVAGLCARTGLSARQVLYRLRKPGAPPAVNASPVSPLAQRRVRYGIWDADQATAFLAGQNVAALPPAGAPEDLLDVAEAADLLGVQPETFGVNVREGRFPPADTVRCGLDHWRRETLQETRRSRPGQGAGGGNPRDDSKRDRVRAALRECRECGEPDPTQSELAKRAGVHRATVRAVLDTEGE